MKIKVYDLMYAKLSSFWVDNSKYTGLGEVISLLTTHIEDYINAADLKMYIYIIIRKRNTLIEQSSCQHNLVPKLVDKQLPLKSNLKG